MEIHLHEDPVEKLKQCRTYVEVGQIYYHYTDTERSKPVRVKDIVLHGESQEPYVLYQQEYGEELPFVIKLIDWVSDILTPTGVQRRYNE